jgi:hypothetical protein
VTPIVPVPKQDGSVRICRHFKGRINPVSSASNRRYFSHSVGGKKFSKIDLRQAYHQIELEEEFKKYSTLQLIRPWACFNTIDWCLVLPRLPPFGSVPWIRFWKELLVLVVS